MFVSSKAFIGEEISKKFEIYGTIQSFDFSRNCYTVKYEDEESEDMTEEEVKKFLV